MTEKTGLIAYWKAVEDNKVNYVRILRDYGMYKSEYANILKKAINSKKGDCLLTELVENMGIAAKIVCIAIKNDNFALFNYVMKAQSLSLYKYQLWKVLIKNRPKQFERFYDYLNQNLPLIKTDLDNLMKNK